jgi:hypothetical protein
MGKRSQKRGNGAVIIAGVFFLSIIIAGIAVWEKELVGTIYGGVLGLNWATNCALLVLLAVVIIFWRVLAFTGKRLFPSCQLKQEEDFRPFHFREDMTAFPPQREQIGNENGTKRPMMHMAKVRLFINPSSVPLARGTGF